MTIDEFYQSLAQRGLAPTPEQAKNSTAGKSTRFILTSFFFFVFSGPKFPTADEAEHDEIVKEKFTEKDDPDMIRYLRAQDEYKDDHHRGEGNRHNRS